MPLIPIFKYIRQYRFNKRETCLSTCMYVFVSEDHMLDWHLCRICYPLEMKLLEREKERESQRGHSLSNLIWTSVMLNRPIAVKFEKTTNKPKKERNEILFSSKNYQHKHFRCLINYTNKSRASYERHRETLCVNFEACLFYTVIHELPPHFREKHWNVHISLYQWHCAIWLRLSSRMT